jgi:predicted enzyme related to lactoylglutathione lyase
LKDVSLIVYTVPDMEAGKRFFRELTGNEPYADSPYYCGYKSGDTEIGLVPKPNVGDVTTLAYWTVDDINARIDALVAAGGTLVQEPTDVGYGMLVASIKEPNGTIVGLRQFPPGK